MKIEATTHSQSRTASHITLSVGRKGGVVVDKELHDSSKNPIANKAVSQAVDEINAHVGRLEELPLVPGTQVDTVVQRIDGSNQFNTASSAGAVSLGAGNKLSAPYSMAEGVNNNLDSTKLGNHIEGSENIASNVEFSHIEGERNNVRNGKGIHVEGGNNEATDNYTHAEGYNNKVAGAGSHAEGLGNEVDVNSMGAHAEGTLNQMIGATYAHVEGYNNIAKAAQSHTEGSSNENRGFAAHVGGVGNTVSGEAAFAHGRGLKVDGTDQVTVGKYNAPKDEAIFSVGTGTSDTSRKTPFYVDKNGNTWIKNFDEANPNSEVSLQQVLADVAEDNVELSQQITATNNRVASAENKISENKAAADKTFAEINNEVEKKADTDKRYPLLTAGFADNLVGRGEATPEEFVFQPTANDVSVQDGTARVKKIKGNSVVWNQNTQFANSMANSHGLKFERSGTTLRISGTVTEAYLYNTASITTAYGLVRDGAHKYYISLDAPQGVTYGISGFSISNTEPFIWSNSAGGTWNGGIAILLYEGDTIDYTFKNPMIVDLTKMFGAGNEPTTVEDFYARIPSGIDIHAYNAGEIISMNTEAIKAVGFNQWDEQWERGIYKYWSNGQPSIKGEDYDNYLRSKNLTKVFPNTIYSVTNGKYLDFSVLSYDAEGNFIERFLAATAPVFTFTTPKNCHFIKFCTKTSSGVVVYTNDICINLSHTGIKNGTYEPYETFTRDLGAVKKYFPNGMRSAGSVADSIEWDSTKQKWVAVQRVGKVDLGSLSWAVRGSSGNERFGVYLADAMPTSAGNVKPNLLCAVLTADTSNNVYLHTTLNTIAIDTGSTLNVYSSHSDATSFKTAMQGVMLYYELAEPIVTEIEDIPELDYIVWDFGTEEALSSVPSAPFRADIIYQFNAVDRIRENTLRLQQLESMLSQMQAAFASMTAQVNNEEV